MEIQKQQVELIKLKASSEDKLIMNKNKSFASDEVILGAEDYEDNYTEIDISQWDLENDKFIEEIQK